MGDLAIAPKMALAAIVFVFSNIGAFYLRALPYIAFMCIYIALTSLPDTSRYFAPYQVFVIKFVGPFVFAIFAVSWHRYCAFEYERRKTGFPLRFGKREIKFALLSVVATLASWWGYDVLSDIFYGIIAIVPTIIIALLVVAILLFLYPAIALDQKPDLKRYGQEGLALATSIVIAVLMIAAMAIVTGLVMSFVYINLGSILGSGYRLVLEIVLEQVILNPIILAIALTSATFLFQHVIGIEVSEENSN